jgi:hypothetical protein
VKQAIFAIFETKPWCFLFNRRKSQQETKNDWTAVLPAIVISRGLGNERNE